MQTGFMLMIKGKASIFVLLLLLLKEKQCSSSVERTHLTTKRSLDNYTSKQVRIYTVFTHEYSLVV